VSGDLVPCDRDAVTREWLARALATYPPVTARFLAEEKDRFRNPVGHALRESLPVVVDELLGEMNVARLKPMLDQVIRMRAVQDFTASEAVGFIFSLKEVMRRTEPPGLTPEIERRIDQLALTAFDLFVECRDKMNEIRVEEARRGTYVQSRIGSSRSEDGMR
jgi:hypothetical protein